MFRKNILITLFIVFAIISSTACALEYTSYIFSKANLIFFAYEDNTTLEIYNADGSVVLDWQEQPVLINNGDPMDKGEHFELTAPDYLDSDTVYKVTGSKRFAVLTGDPVSSGISGYYAMDANGLGTAKEFYTYVPERVVIYPGYENQQFIVFGYEDNTSVTVQQDTYNNGTYQDVSSFTLNKGQHWSNLSLSQKYVHVIADKPVSALTCFDQGYFVPSANGRWSGKEFYTYVSNIGDPCWPEDLTVIAYKNYTSVTITDSDTNDLIWSGTLDNGEPHVVSYPDGADKYITITSDKTVTVSVQPWKSITSNYLQGVFIPDISGTEEGRMGSYIIGSALDDSDWGDAYLNILSHTDNTTVDVYNSEYDSKVAHYLLDRGEMVDAKPGNGLWKIVSDGHISAYSGWGTYTAEFAPLAFAFYVGSSLVKTDDVNDCVSPDDKITYTIDYNMADYSDPCVYIVDELPDEVDYYSSNPIGVYDVNEHTVTWSLGAKGPNDTGTVQVTVHVNQKAPPGGEII
ncbi:MAG: IgGFc-binding protein, partial [Sedimentisphaerales bacterium]|nr:IgGFc-binding protein [Sedimentisphaerales bacterium]